MALESRFLLREASNSLSGSGFKDVVDLGVRTPERGRDASDDGSDLLENIAGGHEGPRSMR
jgi:hypothetical protein